MLHVYGPTESTTFASWYEVTEVPPGSGSVPIGRPISGSSAYVVDGGGELVPVGVAGELWVGGLGVARGYVGAPGLTASRFVPDPFGGVLGGRLYRTGDVVRWRVDGCLEFVGRVDSQVKVRGFRVEPGEVEARLVEHPGVAHAVVVAREFGAGDRRLAAYYVPSAEPAEPGGVSGVSVAGLRAFLGGVLPEYMIPGSFTAVPVLPLTANGKLDVAALPVPVGRPEGAGAPVPAVTPVERVLTEIWGDVLRQPGIGVHDNFFELGGHSLQAVRLAFRVRQELGVELTMHDVLDTATVAAQAERIGRRLSAEQPALTLRLLAELDELTDDEVSAELAAHGHEPGEES